MKTQWEGETPFCCVCVKETQWERGTPLVVSSCKENTTGEGFPPLVASLVAADNHRPQKRALRLFLRAVVGGVIQKEREI